MQLEFGVWGDTPSEEPRIGGIPTRPHVHCDPMCEDCMDAFDATADAIEPAVRDGLMAFWREIRKAYPKLIGTRVPKWLRLESDELEIRAMEAAQAWLFENVHAKKFASRGSCPE